MVAVVVISAKVECVHVDKMSNITAVQFGKNNGKW